MYKTGGYCNYIHEFVFAITTFFTMYTGALFSLISTVQVICGALAFVLYSTTYRLSLDVGLPIGSSFWLMAVLYGISLPMIL